MSIRKENPKIDFVSNEHEILEFWEKNQIFQKLVSQNSEGKKWSFLDGPITANNPMGVHHAWGRTLKDLYQRYKSMNGYQLRYQNGFDCQGLWVEIEVEKELGIKSKKEVEELVPIGELDPNQIHTPGVFVQKIIKGAFFEKRIENKTNRKL